MNVASTAGWGYVMVIGVGLLGSFSFLVMFSWVFSASLKQRPCTEALIKKQKILQQAWEAICNHYQSPSSQLVICRTRKLYLCERILTGEN